MCRGLSGVGFPLATLSVEGAVLVLQRHPEEFARLEDLASRELLAAPRGEGGTAERLPHVRLRFSIRAPHQCCGGDRRSRRVIRAQAADRGSRLLQ